MHDMTAHTGKGPSTLPIALSSGSVFPLGAQEAFRIAAQLGYDGLEIMVSSDPVSQDPDAWKSLMDTHQIPVVAVHTPCLLLTQGVWGTDPWGKVRRSIAAAEDVGAGIVVLHPAFRWQREYARSFIDGVRLEQEDTEVRIAIENMYPWGRVRHERFTLGREVEIDAYRPSWNLRDLDVDYATVDLSHTAASREDVMDLVEHLGPRLAHVHLADGTGAPRDEHLIPGRGNQPCAELLQHLAASGYDGTVVVEVSTRAATTPEQRMADLTEALAFARHHLGQSQ
jgi:sugar phosphate isomerase/epimerase